MIPENVKVHIKTYSIEKFPMEACGVIVIEDNAYKFIPITNISLYPDTFILDPNEYAAIEDKYIIKYIVHSHVNMGSNLSIADSISINKGLEPWIIYSIKSDTFDIHYSKAKSYKIPPYTGRQFIFGIQDCYSLVKDYYQKEHNILLSEYIRQDNFWLRNESPYLDNYTKEGFVEITGKPIKVSDLVLMKLGPSSVPNHGAIYIGGKLLHHVQNRLSEEVVYIGNWQKKTTHVLRHKDLM